MASKDQIAALTEFIVSVGLRLAEQLENEFEAALDRLITRKAALGGQIDLEDYVTTRIIYSGGTSTMSRVKITGLNTTARELAATKLVRDLRSCRLVAVGKPVPDIADAQAPRYDTERDVQLIFSHQWDDLQVSYGQDVVSSDYAAFSDIRVASVAQLGSAQMTWLQQVIARDTEGRGREVVDGAQPGQAEVRARDTKLDLTKAEDRSGPAADAAEDDVELPQDEPGPTPVYGPWSVMPQIERELRRRAAANPKLCKPTWPEESNYLRHWARRFKRDEATKTGDPPGLKWIREKLGNLYYELNPESRHPRRPRQKS